jgi:hypothetical protein
MPDRTLQEIVHKIFPWMKAKEEEEERNFYAQRGIDLQPEYATQVEGKAHGGAENGAESSENGEDSAYNVRLRIVLPRSVLVDVRSTSIWSNFSFLILHIIQVMMSDQLELHLNPDERPPHSHQQLPPLQNGFLRLSGRAKIVTLKKYLIMKLGLKDSSKNSVRFRRNLCTLYYPYE